ncbi:toxin-antitoxin system, antitoxin component, Xre family [Porphyromonas catoniae F0037]|uniref:Toxin-antitoxin system, antitoxin component, Xre family n=1 Tax=Porphyromonas catoniae F0037 TaxID=1127696 RepID=L1NFU1_9PORP|nr:toxin-antitoxin system, antitoxin component, Xre family [Porphyromonas catoniae F0037]
MAKNVGAKLSRKLKQKMQIVGGKLSCLDCVVILVWHRLLGILLVPLEMVPRIEKRFSTASIGIYLQVSYAFQLEDSHPLPC